MQAIVAGSKAVLLIDEVDRADAEFEAFLLEVLSDYQVTIPELGTLVADSRPRVLLTSNDSRDLSDALRRRCLYLHIDYPSPGDEAAILARRVPDLDAELAQRVVRFAAAARRSELKKAPGTAEVIDWALALTALGAPSLDAETCAALSGHCSRTAVTWSGCSTTFPGFAGDPGSRDFAALLRREGIAVSPAELIEAGKALRRVDLGDRDQVRAALGCTLCKRSGQRDRFDELFSRFFAAPPGWGEPGPGDGQAVEGRAGRSPGRRPGAATQRDAQGAGNEAKKDRERRETRPRPEPRASESPRPAAPPPGFRRVVAALREAGREPESVLRLDARTTRGSERDGSRRTGRPRPGEIDLRSRLDPVAETALARELEQLLRGLRGPFARRRQHRARGRLWLRALHRRSLAYGGVPFVLPRQRRRRRPVRVVLLLDVSWSVTRAAGCFWLLVSELLRGRADVRVLPFVDRAVDGTRVFLDWSEGGVVGRNSDGSRSALPGGALSCGGVAMGETLGRLEGLDPLAASDYGCDLRSSGALAASPPGRDTLLVLLGDGRTNRFDPMPWALEELCHEVRHTLWLVPEPRSRWGLDDSALAEYAPHVDLLVETRDLEGLARGARLLLDRL